MIKGFKDFILRGNVIDLAVAVVIGAAFTSIVSTFSDSIIQPLLNAISPPSSSGLGVLVVPGKESTFIDFSAVITCDQLPDRGCGGVLRLRAADQYDQGTARAG